MVRFLKLFIVMSSLASVEIRAAVENDFGYLAFGDLRGSIEPCGCDPATDLGGVKRLAELVERERRAMPKLQLLSLGNILAPEKGPSLKTPFLLEAVASLLPTAYLFNELEARRLADTNSFRKTLPFVLSNLKSKSKWSSWLKDVVETDSSIIFGYARGERLNTETEVFSPALAKRWSARAKKSAAKHKVLLFAGAAQELAAIGKSGLFDAIVSSNGADFSALPGTAEKDDEKRLERLATGPLFQVPLGGQGILRGGSLMFEGGKSIAEILSGDPSPSPDRPLLNAAKVVTWLDRSLDGGAHFEGLFKRYNQAARADFAKQSAERLKDLKSTPYVGDEACRSCHAAAHATWAASKHAHAMATLKAKGKHEDPECVACHVLGAAEKGGFVSLKDSPHFSNVQCETCHGPRKEHVANPFNKAPTKVAAAEVCVTCHNKQHSPAFDAKSYWLRIAHGK